jgi:hypothetical protein
MRWTEGLLSESLTKPNQQSCSQICLNASQIPFVRNRKQICYRNLNFNFVTLINCQKYFYRLHGFVSIKRNAKTARIIKSWFCLNKQFTESCERRDGRRPSRQFMICCCLRSIMLCWYQLILIIENCCGTSHPAPRSIAFFCRDVNQFQLTVALRIAALVTESQIDMRIVWMHERRKIIERSYAKQMRSDERLFGVIKPLNIGTNANELRSSAHRNKKCKLSCVDASNYLSTNKQQKR